MKRLLEIMKKLNAQLLFYAGMIFMLFYSLNFFLSPGIPYSKIFLAMGILLLSCKTLRTKFTYTQKAFIVVAIIFSIVQFFSSGMTYGIVFFSILIASKDINLKQFLNFFMAAGVIVILMAMILSIAHIRGSIYLDATFGDKRGKMVRYCFGFDGPNRLAVFVIGICSAAVYVWWGNFRKIWPYLALTAAMTVLFILTQSRTGLLSGIILVLLTLLLQFNVFSNNKVFQYLISSGLQLFIMIFSFWVAFFPIKGYFWAYTDILFNARFSGIASLFKNEPLNLFGARGISRYTCIDNSYVSFLYIGGVILFLAYIFALELLIRYNIKKKELGAIVAIITFIPACFTTSIMYGIYQNLILFLFIGTWDKLLPIAKHEKEEIFWRKVKRKLPELIYYFINQIKFEHDGIKTGSNIIVNGCIFIENKSGDIEIGSNVHINSSWRSNMIGQGERTILRTYENGHIKIGDGVGMSNTTLVSMKSINIGNDVFIGGGVCIYDTDFHSLDFDQRMAGDAGIKVKAVSIGDRAFIGAGSIILKGTVIGERSIIGAGSVVSGCVPPGQIWAGCPAKFIRNLLEQ